MGVVVMEPLLQRWESAPFLPWARHAVVVQETEQGAQPLGRFGQVPVPVFWETGAIAVDEIDIALTEGVALCVDPPCVLLSGTQKPLDRIRGIAFLVQGSREGIHVRPERALPQSGNHAWPNKSVFKHALLLFLT